MSADKVIYEVLDGGIARVLINSPADANAQNAATLYALNDYMLRATHDPAVKVIILGGVGRHFSSGHDLGQSDVDIVGKDRPLLSTWGETGIGSIERWYGWEHEMYLDMCKRWRALAKPTVAQVQGACIAGGLMLAWSCDLIVAAEDAFFQDMTIDIGVSGVEFFAHVAEIGPRRAKEKLFTADRWSAQDALDWGMVNRVVPREALEEETLALARKIASKPLFALKLAKEAVNGCMDSAGFVEGIDRAFALHHLSHAHNRLRYDGLILDPVGVPQKIQDSLPGGLRRFPNNPEE